MRVKKKKEERSKAYKNKPFLKFEELEMKAFFDDVEAKKSAEVNAKDTQKTWQEKITEARQTLTSLSIEELKKEKIKAQTNLAKATLQNRNAALDFGVPVASLALSILSLIRSFLPDEPTAYTISYEKIMPLPNEGFSKNVGIVLILTGFIIIALFILLACQLIKKGRKHQVFYYQTMLNIIASIEEKRERSNHYNVSIHNTETGETKQFDTYLLPKNK